MDRYALKSPARKKQQSVYSDKSALLAGSGYSVATSVQIHQTTAALKDSLEALVQDAPPFKLAQETLKIYGNIVAAQSTSSYATYFNPESSIESKIMCFAGQMKNQSYSLAQQVPAKISPTQLADYQQTNGGVQMQAYSAMNSPMPGQNTGSYSRLPMMPTDTGNVPKGLGMFFVVGKGFSAPADVAASLEPKNYAMSPSLQFGYGANMGQPSKYIEDPIKKEPLYLAAKN